MSSTARHSMKAVTHAAQAAGFDWAAWLPAGPSPHVDFFRDWVRDGLSGGMTWLTRSVAARSDPRLFRPGTQSVLIAAAAYGTDDPPDAVWNDPARGRVARFAWGEDYHRILDKRLRALAAHLESAAPVRILARFTDSRPVLERAWAEAGGAGIGKNTQCLLPGCGSYLLLGGLLLDSPCPDSTPAATAAPDPCGDCADCLRACPGAALVAPRRLDSRRCLSYWTIEHPGLIPPEISARMGRWIFGCDACQEICPLVRNRTRTAQAPFLRFEPERDAPRLDAVLRMTPQDFLSRYVGCPLERTGLSRFRRNAVVAMARSGLPEAGEALQRAERDPDVLVAGQAALELGRILRSQMAAP